VDPTQRLLREAAEAIQPLSVPAAVVAAPRQVVVAVDDAGKISIPGILTIKSLIHEKNNHIVLFDLWYDGYDLCTNRRRCPSFLSRLL
jgi:hypothetical protein